MMKRAVRHTQPHDPPQIDKRDLGRLVEQMKAMVPHYTPEWRFSPEDPDAGTALFYLVADMLQENIKRLNRVPFDHFISFLDMLQISLRPARPARASVVFALNSGVREGVYVPAGTNLAAAAADGGEDVLFETETALLVTPARLTDWVNVHPGRDRIVWMADDCEQWDEQDDEQPSLFAVEGSNVQEHVLYIGHDELFIMDRPAGIVLGWSNAERRYIESDLARAMSDDHKLLWEWHGEDGWQPFNRITALRNETMLLKQQSGEMKPVVVHGQEGLWIRCRVREAWTSAGNGAELRELPAFNGVSVRAYHDEEWDEAGIKPSMLYGNDLELEAQGFHPFGEHVLPYAVFHMACPEAFSKKGSRITLRFAAKFVANLWRNAPDPEIRWKMIMRTDDFRKKPPERIYIRRVQWEYWNGENWAKLPGSGVYESLFVEMPEEETSMYAMEFQCPSDWSTTVVNGSEDWWLRARVLSTDPMTQPLVEFMSPWLESPSLTYRYTSDAALIPQQVRTLNNADWLDHTITVRGSGQPFQAFVPLDCPAPAVYLGFDLPPLKGPIRLQVTLGRHAVIDGAPPWIDWEYCVPESRGRTWKPLRMNDETKGFTQSGSLQFAGPKDMGLVTMFGKQQAWLRAVNRDGRYSGGNSVVLPTIRRIERNAVPVVQRQTIADELPEAVEGGYILSRTPIISHQLWVDETDFASEQALLEMDPAQFEAIRSSDGKLAQVWVHWEPVASFTGSASTDRHYILDSATGKIRFGDGTKGAHLPREGAGQVRVTYQVTEGTRGNVAEGDISGLLQPIAFIGQVFNSDPAVGGGDVEKLEQAVRRGPQQLKHQGRAVSAADVEWIVRETEPAIARVRCLPGYNGALARESGQYVVIAMPYGGREALIHFSEIKRRMERVLLERAANLVARRVAVRAPAILEISVHAIINVSSEELMLPIENECLAQLDLFLNTMRGQVDGRGWEIGEPVHASALYGPLYAVRGVETVDQLHLSVVCFENGEEREIPVASMQQMPHGLVSSGRHQITVQLIKGG